MLKDIKIKTKLLIIFLPVIVSSVLVIGYTSFSTAKSSLTHARIEALSSIADLKVKKIQSFNFERRADIQTVQSYYNVKANFDTINKLSIERSNPEYLKSKILLDNQLKNFQHAYNYINVFLANPEGKIVYETKDDSENGELDNYLQNINQTAYQEGKKRIFFSEIFHDRLQNYKYEMLMTAPFLSFNNDFIGIIGFRVNMQPVFDSIHDTTGLGRTGETLVAIGLKEKVFFLSSLRHDKLLSFDRVVMYGEEGAYPSKEAVQGKNGSGLSVDYRNKSVIADWRYIPDLGWGIVAKIDTSEAFEAVEQLKKNTVFLIGIVLLFSILISYFFSKTITRPIKLLSLFAEKISNGDMLQETNIKSNDEVGVLAKSFDKMVSDLNKTTVSKGYLKLLLDERNHQLKNTYEKLTHTAKLSAIGRLSASIAHEFSNPIFGVRYMLELIHSKYKNSDDETEKFSSMAISECDRMVELVEKLRDFYRPSTGEKKVIKINDLLDDVLLLTNNMFKKKKITIIKEYDTDLPQVEVVHDKIKQVILNLITNAEQAITNKKGGIVKIKTYSFKNSIRIDIEDNGIGIKEEDIKDIFDPFFSTKPIIGTGLGLSISYSIMKDHGGDISVRSEVGKGTIFSVLLPKYKNLLSGS